MTNIDIVTNALNAKKANGQYVPDGLEVIKAKRLTTSTKFIAQHLGRYGIFKLMDESQNVVGNFSYKSLDEAILNF